MTIRELLTQYLASSLEKHPNREAYLDGLCVGVTGECERDYPGKKTDNPYQGEQAEVWMCGVNDGDTLLHTLEFNRLLNAVRQQSRKRS